MNPAEKNLRKLTLNTQNTNPVHLAIINTPRDYLIKTLRQRSIGIDGQPMGSYYLHNAHELLGLFLLTDWEHYTHQNVQAPATGYIAKMPGVFGMVRLSELPENRRILVVDPKKTGKGQAALEQWAETFQAPMVDFSVALVGPGTELGVEGDILWSVFPGDPVVPSELPADLVGKVLSIDEARSHGVQWVKIKP